MKNFQVEGIPFPSYFSRPVYLDPQYAIAAPEMPFTQELAGTLNNWGFSEVLSEGEPMENYIPEKAQSDQEKTAEATPVSDDADKLQQARRFYTEFQKHAETLFAQVAENKMINFNLTAENFKATCKYIREDHRYLMRAHRLVEPARNEDYLAFHTVHSTIIAIIIGIRLKLPVHRLIELGVASLFHEIGMTKLPQGYLNARALSEQEHKLIYTHPVLSYNILKSMNFPLAVCIAALEHHERENGTGYPQKLAGDHISLYAKIIAVACSYEAISAKRPHKEAKDGYTGMLELLKNEGKQYDDTVVRALVYSLSIYPIGLYVLLSNGKKGQVVDVDPESPGYPIVQVFGEMQPDGKNKTIQTSQKGLVIVRPLTREETAG